MPENKDNSACEIQYNKNFLVVQANELIRSKQAELTLLEAKLVRLVISQVLQNDTDLRSYSCNIVDLADFLGISQSNLYRDIQNIAKSIMQKPIRIKYGYGRNDKPNYVLFPWFDIIQYHDGRITLRLSEALKPFVIGLEKLFTSYFYEAIIKLPTYHSIRLYELLASWQHSTIRACPQSNYTGVNLGKDEFIFTIDYLREFFNCEEKYPNAADFISNVIDRCVTAIRNNTLMRVSYRKIKKGRKIEYIVFKLNSWEEPSETND